jgi:hypothetical protein
METIITSIIGAVSVLLAALIPVWINRRNSSLENRLLGKWDCQWWSDGAKCDDDDMPFILFDRVSNNRISGTGRDKFGRYDMEGTFSNKTITLTTSRPNKSGGEIKLTIAKNSNKLEGIWDWRDTLRSEPYGGDTIWTKSK